MNYLSHYYILKEVDEPAFTLGKVLPDLMRSYGPAHKIRKATDIPSPQNAAEWMRKGVFVHLQTDRLFHNSDFFKQESTRIRDDILQRIENQRHAYFYAHILLELLLDRLLLSEFPSLADRFYTHLDRVQAAEVDAFFDLRKSELTGQSFLKILDPFRQSRYLHSYADIHDFLFAFSRILEKVGLPVPKKMKGERIADIVLENEERIRKNYLQIFREIEENLIPSPPME